jgi:1,4-dihydroxy-2-naphthoate octaprenyltransferase
MRVIFNIKIIINCMNLKSYYLAFHDPLWTLLLSIALFYPIRQLIWVLYVRKKQKKQNLVSEEEKKVLKKRATFTSVFLSIVFSYIYVTQVFN